MRSPLLTRVLALVAGLGLLGLVTQAHAQPEKGSEAPPVEGKEFFNTEKVTFDELSGRLIFVEFFSSG